mmetsp:Transcript_37711/g.57751  ORF Transcript_37711/g.57751 Transcript_37711/m.57751 type:complete len:103 (-) Transcript_37711:889-1197(-)
MDIIPYIREVLFPLGAHNNDSTFMPLIHRKSVVGDDALHHINKNAEDLEMADRMKEKQVRMLSSVKEFQVFKQILDRNSQWLGVSHEVIRGMDFFNLLSPEV